MIIDLEYLNRNLTFQRRFQSYFKFNLVVQRSPLWRRERNILLSLVTAISLSLSLSLSLSFTRGTVWTNVKSKGVKTACGASVCAKWPVHDRSCFPFSLKDGRPFPVDKIRTPDEGLEPATLRFLARMRLKVWCSTDWANRALLTAVSRPGVYQVTRWLWLACLDDGQQRRQYYAVYNTLKCLPSWPCYASYFDIQHRY